jgi:hypothetical protein
MKVKTPKPSKTPTLDSLVEFQERQERIISDQTNFLEKRGWKYTCNTPGSYWMFERKMTDGRTLLVERSFALTLEARLCGEG